MLHFRGSDVRPVVRSTPQAARRWLLRSDAESALEGIRSELS
jgi:hypothetical protein